MMTTEQRRSRLNEVAGRGVLIPVTAYADLDHGMPSLATREWSWWSRIWPRPTVTLSDQSPEIIARAQDAWDASQGFVTAVLERERDREAARQDGQAAADTTRQDRERATEEHLKASIRQDFFAGNPAASDADFERNYPALKDRHMQRLTEQAGADFRQIVRAAL